MRYLSREDMERFIRMPDVMEAVRQAFSMTEKGLIDTPLRTVIPAEKGSLLFMPAYSAALGLAVMKNVNVFPGNAALGRSTTPAEILLIDAETGYTLAMMDGTYVTQQRSGAATGVAFSVLARENCRKGALIGTGGQAEAQLDAMIAARHLQEISIFSLHSEKREAFTEKARAKYAGGGIDFRCAKTADECVEDADLIITVTTSKTPVFDGALVKNGATVSCVGTYEPNKHEIDPLLIARADKIFCDSKEAALSESGDLLIPIRQGLIREDDVCGSLGEVINGTLPGRESENEIIVFETVGIAAQDLVTAGMIYNRMSEK